MSLFRVLEGTLVSRWSKGGEKREAFLGEDMDFTTPIRQTVETMIFMDGMIYVQVPREFVDVGDI